MIVSFMTVTRVDVINDNSMQLRIKGNVVEEGYLSHPM